MSEFHCPKCKGSIRERTFDEVRRELIDRDGVPEKFAGLIVPARTGPFVEWWCESCQIAISSYALANQILKVTQMAEVEGS